MHEEENSSTRCLIKHQNEFRRNRCEAVFLFVQWKMKYAEQLVKEHNRYG